MCRFDCSHPSVEFWRQYSWDARVAEAGSGTQGSWRAFGEVIKETVADPKNADDSEYWMYHCGRSLAFATQGALSLSLHGLRQALTRGRSSSGSEAEANSWSNPLVGLLGGGFGAVRNVARDATESVVSHLSTNKDGVFRRRVLPSILIEQPLTCFL